MRLPRPYIPQHIRILVAERQGLANFGPTTWSTILSNAPVKPLEERLHWLLALLFHDAWNAELHHRPALCNRPYNKRRKDYEPPANDPEHLVYLAIDDHDIETRVRGVGAQRSDLAVRRYNKRVARNRAKREKRKRAHRPIRTSRWPTGRKIANRKR